jgi:hypothetical protein
MDWMFVGRVEQLSCLRRAVCGQSPGPVLITGEPGAGRTTMLEHAAALADQARDEIVWLRPKGQAPFAALHDGLPGLLPAACSHAGAVQAMVSRAAGRRLVLAADDVHLMDLPSLLALQEASRAERILLIATRAARAAAPGQPDPSECLSYERGLQRLALDLLTVQEVAQALSCVVPGPLEQAAAEAVHAATDGNPRLLRALVTGCQLTDCLVSQDGQWRLAATGENPCASAPGHDGLPRYRGGARLAEATWRAWRELATERADQLCRIALWCGEHQPVAPVWAMLLLLRGQPLDALAFLDSLPSAVLASPPSALVKALALAIGMGRIADAEGFLKAVDTGDFPARQLLTAFRAWLLAITGDEAAASGALHSIDRGNRETALFVHAARAALAQRCGFPGEPVFHWRRALATAESGSDQFPWIRPYLTASLIDALLTSGRGKEAVSLAERFHARELTSGWEIAAATATLMTG